MAKKKKTLYTGKTLLTLLLIAAIVGAWRYCEAKLAAKEAPTTKVESLGCTIDDLMSVQIPSDVNSHRVEYPGFVVSFNSKYKQPNWVAWELTGAESQANETTRQNSTFAPDMSVPGCPTLADYKNSGYDKGHMCPAGDMKWDQQAMDACFLLTNMSPQSHALNSGAWNTLEDRCRYWAVRDSAIIVICGPVLTDRLTRTIGDNKVAVPERYFKVILAPYADPVRAIGFIMPNGKVQGGMQACAVSIDEVEMITGFDFFAALPDDLENAIEADCNLPLWNQKKKKTK